MMIPMFSATTIKARLMITIHIPTNHIPWFATASTVIKTALIFVCSQEPVIRDRQIQEERWIYEHPERSAQTDFPRIVQRARISVAQPCSKCCFDTADYREAMSRAKKGDLVYCDPPYTHSQPIIYGAQDFSIVGLWDAICRLQVARSLCRFVD